MKSTGLPVNQVAMGERVSVNVFTVHMLGILQNRQINLTNPLALYWVTSQLWEMNVKTLTVIGTIKRVIYGIHGYVLECVVELVFYDHYLVPVILVINDR